MKSIAQLLLTFALPIVVLISSFAVIGQEMGWTKSDYTFGSFKLPYQLYIPPGKEKLPLIIHLHGSGEAGTDNESQMYSGTNYGPQYFASKANQAMQKAFVLAPQTPQHVRWASTSLKPYDFEATPPTASMSALLSYIDKLINDTPNIDVNRIYIAGLSRGGQGVWNALLQRPNFFAAAIPIAGSADPNAARSIATIPTWVFAGDSDQTTDVQYSRTMVDEMIRAGGSTANIRFTEIEGGNHEAAWKVAYGNPDVYQWLVRQSK